MSRGRQMRRRSRAGSTKPRRRKAPAAKRRRGIETTRGVTSSASKEKLRLLSRKLSEARRHRRRAEEALRESEDKLRQIIETVPCHFWSVSPDGKYPYLNRRLLEYFGMRIEDTYSVGWQATLHPDDVAETERVLSHAF